MTVPTNFPCLRTRLNTNCSATTETRSIAVSAALVSRSRSDPGAAGQTRSRSPTWIRTTASPEREASTVRRQCWPCPEKTLLVVVVSTVEEIKFLMKDGLHRTLLLVARSEERRLWTPVHALRYPSTSTWCDCGHVLVLLHERDRVRD